MSACSHPFRHKCDQKICIFQIKAVSLRSKLHDNMDKKITIDYYGHQVECLHYAVVNGTEVAVFQKPHDLTWEKGDDEEMVVAISCEDDWRPGQQGWKIVDWMHFGPKYGENVEHDIAEDFSHVVDELLDTHNSGKCETQVIDNGKKHIEIGDLVETCNMLPGFVTQLDGDDDCRVITIGSGQSGAGGSHSLHNCGVHRISEKRAMSLVVIGEERLNKLYNGSDVPFEGFDFYNDEHMWRVAHSILRQDYLKNIRWPKGCKRQIGEKKEE